MKRRSEQSLAEGCGAENSSAQRVRRRNNHDPGRDRRGEITLYIANKMEIPERNRSEGAAMAETDPRVPIQLIIDQMDAHQTLRVLEAGCGSSSNFRFP